MAHIKMEILAESVDDFRETLARLLGSTSISVAVDPVPTATDIQALQAAFVQKAAADMAEKVAEKATPKAAGRPKKAEPASPIRPMPEGMEQRMIGTTAVLIDPPTVEEATAAAEATASITATPEDRQPGPLASSAVGATAAASPSDNSVAATAAAPAPQPTLPSPTTGSDATYEDVKQALIALMDKKSASVVQGLLKDHFGVPAISQLDKSRYGEAKAKLTEWANG